MVTRGGRLLSEGDRLLDGRDLSREFMNECVHLFMITLCSHWGRVSSVELGNTLEAAVREQARLCPRAPLARGAGPFVPALSRERFACIVVSPPGAYMRAWRGRFLFARRGSGLFRGWKGGVSVWLVPRACGALTATVW